MAKKYTILAIIPARAGSTRLKNKNHYPLAGKPLIEYTMDAVINTETFDEIIVSTDSDPIVEIAKNKSLRVIPRPPHYSGDKITVVSAIIDLMKNLDQSYDKICYFLPTCPLRNTQDILEGLNLLETSDSVISVTKYSSPIQLAMIPGENKQLHPVFDNLRGGLTNSKYIQSHVRPNGGFYMSDWNQVLESGHFFNGLIRGHEMPTERSIDIDNKIDIEFAEKLLGRDDNN